MAKGIIGPRVEPDIAILPNYPDEIPLYFCQRSIFLVEAGSQ